MTRGVFRGGLQFSRASLRIHQALYQLILNRLLGTVEFQAHLPIFLGTSVLPSLKHSLNTALLTLR